MNLYLFFYNFFVIYIFRILGEVPHAMRRINRFFLLFCTCFLFVIIMSGCGFFIRFDQTDDRDNELAAVEVLNQAHNRINSLTGYHILAKGQVNQLQGQQGKNYHFELNQQFYNEPKIIHSIRNFYQNGTTSNQEMYIVDGITYVNNGPSWIRSTNQQEKSVFSQNPSDFLRFASEANGQGLSIEKESDTYVVKLNQNAGRAFLHQFYAETIEAMKLQGVYVTENDIQTQHFQQSIWIEEETFDFEKMETNLVYDVQYNGNTIRYDSGMQVVYQGELKEPIQLPSEIKRRTGS